MDEVGRTMTKMLLRSLLVIIFVSSWLVGCSGREMKETAKRSDMFLVHFDRTDLQRMEKFVARFHDSKGDYLMAIPLTIEGGPVIYDLHSDGKRINIMIDTTRDAYSSDRSQSMLVCGNIAMETVNRDGDTYKAVRVSDCDQSEEGVRLFQFAK